MSGEPTLTIGLPVYNGQRYLREAVESILDQTLSDFELIVSDNASTDATPDICRDIAARDPRVSVRRNERNLGAAANYNVLLELARGRYFKWLAHDDTYAPTFLERCAAALESDADAVLAYAPAVFVGGEGEEIAREDDLLDLDDPDPAVRFRRWVFEKRLGWCHPVMGLIRTDVLRRTPAIGPYAGSDRNLVAELSLWGKMHRLEEHLFYRRDHEGRSVRAHGSSGELTEWFDTTRARDARYYPNWRRAAEYARSVARAPVSGSTRLRCWATIARWMVRSRRQFENELIEWCENGRGRTTVWRGDDES